VTVNNSSLDGCSLRLGDLSQPRAKLEVVVENCSQKCISAAIPSTEPNRVGAATNRIEMTIPAESDKIAKEPSVTKCGNVPVHGQTFCGRKLGAKENTSMLQT